MRSAAKEIEDREREREAQKDKREKESKNYMSPVIVLCCVPLGHSPLNTANLCVHMCACTCAYVCVYEREKDVTESLFTPVIFKHY